MPSLRVAGEAIQSFSRSAAGLLHFVRNDDEGRRYEKPRRERDEFRIHFCLCEPKAKQSRKRDAEVWIASLRSQ
jgi:hypothetical protein